MADAIRAADQDRLPNELAVVHRFGRDHAGEEFARVHRQLDLRIALVEVGEHVHLQVIVVQRFVVVLRFDRIDGDDARVDVR